MAWSELLRTSYETCTSCPGWTGAVACIARKFHGRPSRKLESNCISTVRFESCWMPDTSSALCSRLNPVSWHTFAYRGGSTYPKPNMTAATAIRITKSLRWRVAVVIRKGYLITGGILNEFRGAGDGKVHSSPTAPSHTWLLAGAPRRTHFTTT